MFQPYETIETTRDINPVAKKGMKGLIVEIWGNDGYEVEFVKEDGDSYQYNNESIFTLKAFYITKPSN